MSAGDETTPRPSVLTAFCPVPERAMRDKRFGAGHHACLEAICWAIDKYTGCAIASQSRIADLTDRPRNKVARFLGDLEQWAYIRKIKRGRHKAGSRKGRYRVLVYRVLYDADEAGAMLPLGSQGCEVGAMLPLGSQSRVNPEVTDSRVFQDQRKKEERSIFRAVAEADRLDRVAEVAQQMELPFAEVQRFDDLYLKARSMHGFTKVVKLDLAIKRRHRRDPPGYLRALSTELEKLINEASEDCDARDVSGTPPAVRR